MSKKDLELSTELEEMKNQIDKFIKRVSEIIPQCSDMSRGTILMAVNSYLENSSVYLNRIISGIR